MGKAFDLRLIRRLSGFLRPYLRLFTVCIALTLALSGLRLVLPYLAKVEIDSYLTLPHAIVESKTPPQLGGAIPIDPDHYLVDMRQVGGKTKQEWEKAGLLSSERYLFVPETDSSLAERYPDSFTEIPGGYMAAATELGGISAADLTALRRDSLTGVYMLAGLFGGILLLQFLFGIVQVYTLQFTGQRVMYDMRRRIFDHVLRLPISFFDRTPVGRVVTRVTNDVQAINEMFSSMLVNLFRDAFLIIGLLGIMFVLNWRLALVILALFPFIVIAALQFRKRVRSAYREVRRRLAQLNSYLQESISGMRIIQVFVQELRANERFTRINQNKYLANMRQLITFAVFRPLMSLLSSFAIALVIWYGGGRVLTGGLSLGALTAFIHYVRMLFEPILELSQGYNVLQAAMAASERIFILLDEPVEEKGHGETIPEFKGRIEFRDVWFAYNDSEWVLKGVSFTAAPGERVAIVGPTGSGKTTIIRLLLRMYPIPRGQILVDGVPIEQLDLGYLRSCMAVVLQDVFLFSGDIMDNIRLRSGITEEAAVSAARFAGAEFVEELPNSYRTEVKERGATLSSGERQLLSFARAVAFNPYVLVLDEATASIDSHTEEKIQRSLRKIMRGRTSIVIAHRLSTIREANKIIVLHRGKIVEQGTHQQLLALDGLYAAMHTLQFTGVGTRDPGPG
jgi:ABC-type multidrug transport system fused ATPase/permease subunit